MLDIVEGAYNSVVDNLIEMKTLSTQGANDTLSSTERTYIAKQINALGFDINDIAAYFQWGSTFTDCRCNKNIPSRRRYYRYYVSNL